MNPKSQRWLRFKPWILTFVSAVLLAFLTTALIRHHNETSKEIEHITMRYEAMRTAIADGDTNAIRALYAPATSGRRNGNHDLLARFAKPLVPQSRIRFSDNRASVCPVPLLHYHFLPGGHLIGMVKVEDEWFFTGSVDID